MVSFLAERQSEGAYSSLMRDLHLQSGFKNFVRMTPENFEFLLNLIGPEFAKTRSYRMPISPGEILAANLIYLATVLACNTESPSLQFQDSFQ